MFSHACKFLVWSRFSFLIFCLLDCTKCINMFDIAPGIISVNVSIGQLKIILHEEGVEIRIPCGFAQGFTALF